MPSGKPITRDLMETAWEWLEFADRIKLPDYDPTVWQQLYHAREDQKRVDNICQCGVESIGEGIHSGWCPKGE